ncbi:hypoxanthine phosphoribosyltransferase [Ferroacidibacillus organovorans]|uniref:Hypoxanthine phosphoribosyltransferase n=1 Tax=Ferroacidibacillus organovorans TaxID=1765683 RepID=A0A162UQT2_9BACL|nr:hypoxanthine phosphoribosyltransferase [Ferroacidibacillus organovorans]KYP81966.1 hypoxanthine phosphoribosyltransferase [Ferroacidibacillus organovorans]OAG94989.1 hypoxanthine phosphoribosyltransferase [Ferroacidibacillus organovorans]OPG15055.1 hypoxanthine phosphoribosyltransferase [Ferroacidibacillus organovorans]
MHPDIESILCSREQIDHRVQEMAKEISSIQTEQPLIVVGVLKGAFLFMADLVRNLTLPLEMDFIATSSYGASTKSSGVVQILKDLERPVEGRDVLLVEDIVDSGLTLSYLRDSLLRRGANSVRIASAFDKPSGRTVKISPDFAGFTVPGHFLVGYGLDYAERYRELPYVGVLKPSVYAGAQD